MNAATSEDSRPSDRPGVHIWPLVRFDGPMADPEDPYGGTCPRCLFVDVDYRPEDVDGAPWTFTHQCPLCGMGVHRSRITSRHLTSCQALYEYLEVDDFDGFEGWASDHTDDMITVHLADDAIEVVGGRGGSLIEFPIDFAEIVADLESAEDDARTSWTGFEGEAAQRLVPLSRVDAAPHPGPGARHDAMPDDWIYDEEADTWFAPAD